MGFEGALNAASQSLLCGARAIEHLGVYLRNRRYCFPLLWLESELLFGFLIWH